MGREGGRGKGGREREGREGGRGKGGRERERGDGEGFMNLKSIANSEAINSDLNRMERGRV